MKPWIKILFISAVLLAFFFSAAHIFMLIKAKPLIVAHLENFTKKKVSIGSINLKFPLTLEARNLNIQGLAKVDYIYISPSILGLIAGNIALNEVRIIGPQIYLEKQIANIVPETPLAQDAGPTTAKPPQKHPTHLVFKHFSLKDGKVVFFDKTAGPEGIKIIVKDIYFNIDNLYLLPKSVIANFQLKGKIPWQKDSQEGSIEAEGWLNLFKKDMRASVNIKNIDGLYLYPYYSKWMDLEKSRIQQARLNFISEVTGHNNDVVADCHLELTDIVFKPREEQVPEEKAYKIATAVLDLFKALDGKINLDFTIKTKMDRPEFGFENIRMAVEDKIAKSTKQDKLDTILSFPSKIIESTVKGATDITRAVIEGTTAVGKEIKKGAEEIFKKEPEEKKE